MIENIDAIIEPYREKLKDYYTITVEYDQPENGISSHYNTIKIKLKSGYTDADFYHELMHVEFLTQENVIRYNYPVEKFFEEKDRYDFVLNLDNLVYDIYVDAYLADHYHVEPEYFERKKKGYEIFLKNLERYYQLKEVYLTILKHAVVDYIDMLDQVLNGTIAQSHFVLHNTIQDQRGFIDHYMEDAGIRDEFEWITHRTIHERELAKKVK